MAIRGILKIGTQECCDGGALTMAGDIDLASGRNFIRQLRENTIDRVFQNQKRAECETDVDARMRIDGEFIVDTVGPIVTLPAASARKASRSSKMLPGSYTVPRTTMA